MKKETKFEQSEDIEYKFILLGDTSVGKTCLFKKLTTGSFIEKNVSTVGIDRRTIKVKCDYDENGETITKNTIINLTDTARQERFKAITKSYYKGSDAALLLYDITDRRSFVHLNEWIDSIKNAPCNTNNNKYCIFLLGTKIDLVENQKRKREVELEEATKLCEEYGLIWGGERSNKNLTSEQYIEIFKDFIKIIYSKIGYKKIVSQNSVKLETKLPKKRNNCVCLK
jgi:Ras-related protein Rab-1A